MGRFAKHIAHQAWTHISYELLLGCRDAQGLRGLAMNVEVQP